MVTIKLMNIKINILILFLYLILLKIKVTNLANNDKDAFVV